jgi:N utilization substance protein A
VEQQMSAMQGGPATPVEQVVELGETILEKLIAAGITTVEQVADMTAEELGEVPGIGEKSVERIATAVRHYFGQYEEGEARPVADASEDVTADVLDTPADTTETSSMSKTPEEILAEAAALGEPPVYVEDISAEDLAAQEEVDSASDANDDADRREERIETDNDTVDTLVDNTQEFSDEGVSDEGHQRD